MIKLDKRRDVLAMNLTYAEQRALEIGITIAGGASVILLDEPTAGMSKSETARFVNLIREVTVGKTLLTVEHDMGVVFGLADKIAVLVYGEVIAFDEHPRFAPTRACRKPTWARRWPTRRPPRRGIDRHAEAVTTSTPSTARAMCCMASTSTVANGEIVALLGRNGSGRSTTVKAIMGWSTAAAASRGRARRSWARRPSRSPTPASATCPRTATSSPRSRCTRTCCWGRRAARKRRQVEP